MANNLTEQPVDAAMQALHAQLHGVTLDDQRRVVGPDGQPLHEETYHSPPPGYTLRYDTLPAPLLQSIQDRAAVDDGALPWWVDPASPEAQEFTAAVTAFVGMHENLADPNTEDGSPIVRAQIQARYEQAENWRQLQCTMHRQSVQIAHGVPIGPDQILAAPSGPALQEG